MSEDSYWLGESSGGLVEGVVVLSTGSSIPVGWLGSGLVGAPGVTSLVDASSHLSGEYKTTFEGSFWLAEPSERLVGRVVAVSSLVVG